MSRPALPLLHYFFDDFTEPWSPEPAPVVLLHPGLGGTGLAYRQWVPVLGDRYRVLRVDARGQGLSSDRRPAGYQFSLDAWVADVLAVLDHREIEQVHWAGASGGGIVGQYAAATRPDRIASLSLIATTPRFRGHEHDFDEWLEPLRQGDVAGFLRGDEERRFGTDNPRRTDWILRQMELTPAPTVLELHQWVKTIDLRPLLPRIACPALIVTGEHDTLTDLNDADLMAREIPNARLEVVRGLPHNIAYTHPRLVAGIVGSFIDDVTGLGSRARG
jgi:pimeloyl-ACP methyl ester carboxylesterase